MMQIYISKLYIKKYAYIFFALGVEAAALRGRK
jgi:hypothetical protein